MKIHANRGLHEYAHFGEARKENAIKIILNYMIEIVKDITEY